MYPSVEAIGWRLPLETRASRPFPRLSDFPDREHGRATGNWCLGDLPQFDVRRL